MLSIAWFVTALLLFLAGLQFIHSGRLFGVVIGGIFFLLTAICLFGFNWSLRGFRPDHTIMPDGEKIDHGK